MKKGICGMKCAACIVHDRCGGCSICDYVFCQKNCEMCFCGCPKDKKIFAYVKNLQAYQASKMIEPPPINLTEIIPVIPDRNVITECPYDIIGVHGETFFTSNGENIAKVYRNNGLQIKGKEGVLEFYVKDRILEGVWDNRKELYRQLKGFPWRAIISPNFSVYEDTPRIDHLRNIERSTIMFDELVENNLPAVPDISWFNANDLDRWTEEINTRNIKTIAFSFQVVGTGLRAANTYVHYAVGLDYLCKGISPDVEIIIAGITSPKRLEIIRSAGIKNKFIVINQSAFIHSRRGQLSETGKKPQKELSKNELFKINLKYYEDEYRRINNA